MSFASLGRFIPRYFIIFDMMVSGIISLISLSHTEQITQGQEVQKIFLLLKVF